MEKKEVLVEFEEIDLTKEKCCVFEGVNISSKSHGH